MVFVDVQPTIAELANQEIAYTITIEIVDVGSGMANFDIDRLAVGLNPKGFLKISCHGNRRGRKK
jgi:hypothetical protein